MYYIFRNIHTHEIDRERMRERERKRERKRERLQLQKKAVNFKESRGVVHRRVGGRKGRGK